MSTELAEFLRNLSVDRGLAADYAADPEAVLAESTLSESDKAQLRRGLPATAPAARLLDAEPGF